jgi:hypothetical protein
MAYFATIRFNSPTAQRDRLIRIEAGSILHAALSAEMICKGYLIGCGRKAEVTDIKNYSRAPQQALETTDDFIMLYTELEGARD